MLLTVKGRLQGWLVFAVEAGEGFGVVELGYVLCLRETGRFVGISSSVRFDDTRRAGRFCSRFLPSRILTLRFAWRM